MEYFSGGYKKVMLISCPSVVNVNAAAINLTKYIKTYSVYGYL